MCQKSVAYATAEVKRGCINLKVVSSEQQSKRSLGQ